MLPRGRGCGVVGRRAVWSPRPPRVPAGWGGGGAPAGPPPRQWRWVCNEGAAIMRIAQVAPLYEPVPPRLYGGTERVVSYLTEELVRRGHDVTLFASGDSQTAAHLVAVTEHALRLDANSREVLAADFSRELGRVFGHARDFDGLQWHVD